jgi:predicted kinase
MIIIVFGLPGSGKTYFARALANTLQATYINSDTIRETFPDQNRYSRPDKNIVYDMMLNKMMKAMHEGQTVVLDATFYKNDLRRRFTSYVREQDLVYFVEIVANELLIKDRLSRRRNSHADFDTYKLVKDDWDPVQFPHLTIQSTDDNITEMISQALDYIKPISARQNN